MARRGHRVFVLARARGAERHYTESDGVSVRRILPKWTISGLPGVWRMNRIWEGYHLAVAISLRELVRKHGVEIIEAPSLHGEPLLFQLTKMHVPVIVRIHSCMPRILKFNETDYRLSLRISSWQERASVFLASALSAPSHTAVADNLRYLHITVKKVEVIPNPVDSCMFVPPNRGEDPDDISVLYIGRLECNKGAHILGRAIPAVLREIPEATFVFLGKDGRSPNGGSMRQWIEDNVPPAGRGNLRFENSIPHRRIVTYYQNAAVVAFPSLWESFGYVALEAMSCARAVVASRSGGPEEIIEDGRDGFLVPVGDSERLAERIIYLLRDAELRREVGKAARKKIEAKYDTKIIAEKMEAYYGRN